MVPVWQYDFRRCLSLAGRVQSCLRPGSSSCGALPFALSIRMTKPKQSGAFSGYRFPAEILAYAVWAYHRFSLSLRDAVDIFSSIVASWRVMTKPAYQAGLTRLSSLPKGKGTYSGLDTAPRVDQIAVGVCRRSAPSHPLYLIFNGSLRL